MNAVPHVVTSEVVLDLIGPDGPAPVGAELRYDPADPYAVALTFFTGAADVVWVFGRDLLIGGVSRPVGDGDVQVFPSLDSEARAVVGLVLRSPSGRAFVNVPASDVLAFLARSTRAVWPGTEGDHISPDEAIAEILVNG